MATSVKQYLGTLMLGCSLLLSSGTWALGQPSVSKELEEELEALKKRMQEIEQSQKASPPSPGSEFLSKFRFAGQLALRSEYIANENFSTNEERWRQRFRLRAGFTYNPVDPFQIGVRLSSGDPKFPSTGWETFGSSGGVGEDPEGNSSKVRMNLDRVFMSYTAPQYLTVTAGKFEFPFFKPQAVWGSGIFVDDDVQPAGVAETFQVPDAGPFRWLRLTFGQFVLEEIQTKGTLRGSGWIGQQVSGKVSLAQQTDLTGGVGYYEFFQPDKIARGVPIFLSSGKYNNRFTNRAVGPGGSLNCTNNSTTGMSTCTGFLSEFRIIQPNLQLTTQLGGIPLLMTVDYVNNLGAKSEPATGRGPKNNAFLAFVAVGSSENPRELRVGAGYYYSQADSVLSVYADDDYQFTNIKTFIIDFQYRIWKNVLIQWDTYIQRFEDPTLAFAQGITSPFDNPTKIRSRISTLVNF